MYLVVDENARFLRGAGQRVFRGFAAGDRLFLFLKIKPGLWLPKGFIKGTFLDKFLFLRDSCFCRVQSVGCFV